MSTEVGSDSSNFSLDTFYYSLHPHYRRLLKSFKKVVRTFTFFNLLYIVLFSAQITLFIYFLNLFAKSTIIAFALGGLFLTFFSYFVLLFYFQSRKPEQLHAIVEEFAAATKDVVPIDPNSSEYHLSIAHAAIHLFSYLDGFERSLYFSKNAPKGFKNPLEKISFLFHFQDVNHLKQLLLRLAIEEHFKQIRISPTDLEVHTSLANSYVLLANFYEAAASDVESSILHLRYKKYLESLQSSFQRATKLAIEEFSIINSYAPDDPWVHMQLAKSYRDLGMFDEEITEYETVLSLSSHDEKILFKLGELYFEHGYYAKGLKSYEELKEINIQLAEELIASYGDPQKGAFSHLFPDTPQDNE